VCARACVCVRVCGHACAHACTPTYTRIHPCSAHDRVCAMHAVHRTTAQMAAARLRMQRWAQMYRCAAAQSTGAAPLIRDGARREVQTLEVLRAKLAERRQGQLAPLPEHVEHGLAHFWRQARRQLSQCARAACTSAFWDAGTHPHPRRCMTT